MPFSVRQAMLNVAPFTKAELDYIESHFQERMIPRKQHLFIAGEICKLACYCQQGCFRKYYVNDNGDEIVVDFAVEDYWVGDLASLINRTPTLFSFQALEDCTLQAMTSGDWDRLNKEIPRFSEARKGKELRSHNAAVQLLAVEKYASAEEKYELLLKRFPGLPNRIPAIHIASYLGIKPESLSRLKRKFAGK